MSSGMMSLQSAPRDPEKLKMLPDSVRWRLCYQLGMFPDDTEEQKFLGAPLEKQCEAMAAMLQQYDAQRGAVQAPEETPQQPQIGQPVMPPQQPMQPGVPQMGQPAMPPQQQQQQQQQQPPSMPQMQVPGGQPTAAAPPPPPPQQPSLPMGGPPGMPPMQVPQQPAMPPMAAPEAPPRQPAQAQPPAPPPQAQPPQMAAQPPMAPPPRQPATTSDPKNEGQVLGVLRGLNDGLKGLANANGANTKVLESLQQNIMGQTKLLEVLLTMVIVTSEQQGLDPNTFAAMCNRITDEQRAQFLSKLGTAKGKG